MSWESEHGEEYEVPEWFDEHMEDRSWHNDDRPRFVLGPDNGPHIEAWIGDPDIDERDGDPSRYLVWLVSDGHTVEQEHRLIELRDAIAKIQQLALSLGLPPPPGLEGAPPPVSSDLGLINRYRRKLGLLPLDPTAAGWQPEDIATEAARVRALNPLVQRLL